MTVLVVVEEEMKLVAPTTSEDLGATFATLQKSLRNYLRRQVDDPSIAEDLVQDVFVKALAAINSNRDAIKSYGLVVYCGAHNCS